MMQLSLFLVFYAALLANSLTLHQVNAWRMRKAAKRNRDDWDCLMQRLKVHEAEERKATQHVTN